MEAAFRQKSFPEQYIGYICRHNFEHVELNKKMSNGMEADIAIYDINTIIEYSGKYWHSDEDRDKRKRDFIENNGVRLITIWEYRVNKIRDEHVVIKNSNEIEFYRANKYSKGLDKLVLALSSIINMELIIPENIDDKVMDMVETTYREQCLAVQYPEIARELVKYDPYKLFSSDARTFTWKCSKCKAMFKTSIAHRTRDKTGCPFCSGNLATPHVNDIITLFPEFAKEIDGVSQDELLNTLAYSSKKVRWRCSKCNTTWESKISSRTLYKTSCKKCGFNPYTKNINTDEWMSIRGIIDANKPISSIILEGNEYININTSDVIGILLESLLDNNSLLDIIDKGDLVNSRSYIDKISTNIADYNIAKKILSKNNIDYFIEGKASTIYNLKIIESIVNTFNMDAVFKVKEEYKLPKNVTIAKNGVDYNVMLRIDHIQRYIGRRSNVNDATILKLSAEVYIFGHIKSVTDTYVGELYDFTTTQEFKKLKDKTWLRRN